MGPKKTFRILIVEEESLIGWSLASALRKDGYLSDVVENGEDALRRVREGGYDLVISDIRLPRMDGLDLANRVKTISREIPVIIVSADEDVVRPEVASQIDYYLEKPFNLGKMLDLVHEILDSTGSGLAHATLS